LFSSSTPDALREYGVRELESAALHIIHEDRDFGISSAVCFATTDIASRIFRRHYLLKTAEVSIDNNRAHIGARIVIPSEIVFENSARYDTDHQLIVVISKNKRGVTAKVARLMRNDEAMKHVLGSKSKVAKTWQLRRRFNNSSLDRRDFTLFRSINHAISFVFRGPGRSGDMKRVSPTTETDSGIHAATPAFAAR
jgi:hypothetical protein